LHSVVRAAQIAAIDQEENTPRTGVLDQPINEVAGRIGFAAAAGHLDEGSRSTLGQRFLQVVDRGDLSRAKAVSDERGKTVEPRTHGRTWVLNFLCHH
jgi:hypothetical protein